MHAVMVHCNAPACLEARSLLDAGMQAWELHAQAQAQAMQSSSSCHLLQPSAADHLALTSPRHTNSTPIFFSPPAAGAPAACMATARCAPATRSCAEHGSCRTLRWQGPVTLEIMLQRKLLQERRTIVFLPKDARMPCCRVLTQDVILQTQKRHCFGALVRLTCAASLIHSDSAL